MNTQEIITLVSMLVALVGIVIGYILQRDSRKIRDLERDNKKYKARLLKALNAIKGYQLIEEDYAEREGIDVKLYRSRIRKDKQELFNTSFLAPAKVEEMMRDLEEE